MRWFTSTKRFFADERGSGSTFMVAMLPVSMVLAGLAIDGASVYREHGRLQATADAAALAGAAELPNIANAGATAVAYAEKNMPTDTNGNVLAAADVYAGNWNQSTRTFTAGGSPANALRVIVRRSASNSNAYPTTFLGLVGVTSWDVSAQATATAKDRVKAWVALVLDNTGSMCQPSTQNPCPGITDPNVKINALKTAAKQLIAQLRDVEAEEGDVQFSIVPFTRDVNVGTSNVNASWLSWTDFLASPATPSQSIGPGSTCPWSGSYGCQSSPVNGSSSVTKIPSSGTYKGYICPSATSVGHYWNGCFNSVSIGNGKYSHTWIPNATSTWGGCLTDRNQNYDTLNTTPSGTDTLFVAENSPSCPATSIMSLTDPKSDTNLAALNARVDAMQASGSTNQTIGLALGWQTLTAGTPYNAPPPPEGTVKYMVLLSDGYNTQNRWTGDGSSHSSAVDTRMALACTHAKADGLKIFTVFVDLNGSQGNSQVLQSCASSSDMYFHLTSSGQIITTFNTIGKQITRLRLVE